MVTVNFKYPWAPGKAISVEDSVIYYADEETTPYREQGIGPVVTDGFQLADWCHLLKLFSPAE